MSIRAFTVEKTAERYKIIEGEHITELPLVEANILYQQMLFDNLQTNVLAAAESVYGKEVAGLLPEEALRSLVGDYYARYFNGEIRKKNAASFVTDSGDVITQAVADSTEIIAIVAVGDTTYSVRQHGYDFSLVEKSGRLVITGNFDAVMAHVGNLFMLANSKPLATCGSGDSSFVEPLGRVFVGKRHYTVTKHGVDEFAFALLGAGAFELKLTLSEVIAKIKEQIASAADLESPESKEAKFLAKIKALWAEFTRVKAEGTDFFYASDLFEVVVRDLVNLVKGMGVYERELFGSRMAPIEKSPLLRFNYSDLANQALDTDWGDGAARDVVADAIEGAFAAELDVAMATLSELYQCRTGRRLGDE